MDNRYYNYRAFGLIVSLICMLVTSYQIFVYYYFKETKTKKTADFKWWIHLGCLFTIFFLLIGFIDPCGVFSLISYEFQRYGLTIGSKGVMFDLCIVIWGHFSAHYQSLKKQIPKSLGYFFIIICITYFIFSIIGLTLTIYIASKYYRIETIFTLIWFSCILGADLYGYKLIRRVLLDLMEVQKNFTNKTPVSSSQSLSSRNENNNNTNLPISAKDLLRRITRYHMLFTFVVGLYIWWILFHFSQNDTATIAKPDPNHLDVNANAIYLPFTYYMLYIFLTWWAWIPLTSDMITSKKSTHSKHNGVPQHKNESTTHGSDKTTRKNTATDSHNQGQHLGGEALPLSPSATNIELIPNTPTQSNGTRFEDIQYSESEQHLLRNPSSPSLSASSSLPEIIREGGGEQKNIKKPQEEDEGLESSNHQLLGNSSQLLSSSQVGGVIINVKINDNGQISPTP